MSRIAQGLTAAFAVSTVIAASPVAAQGQAQVFYQPPAAAAGRYAPCGAPPTGKAPDIMTYDKETGTQIFVGGGRGDTEVAAYNPRTRSAAALSGDLASPGLVSSCAVDGSPGGGSYAARSDGNGHVQVNGRDAYGSWSMTRRDGVTDIGGPGREHRCFKSGLGLFSPNGNLGLAVASAPGAVGVGIAAGHGFGGVGVGSNRNFAGVGVVGC